MTTPIRELAEWGELVGPASNDAQLDLASSTPEDLADHASQLHKLTTQHAQNLLTTARNCGWH